MGRSNATSSKMMSQKVTIFKEGEDFMLLEAASRFCSNSKQPSVAKNSKYLSTQKKAANARMRSDHNILCSREKQD